MMDEMQDVKLQLHKEKLDITMRGVETNDVKVYKNTYTEVKQILVPVVHEELVIEKKELIRDQPNIEVTRIPMSEERIEVTLHPTVLQKVTVEKHQFEEEIQVSETLKEEKLLIETVGDINVEVNDQASDV